MATRRESVLIEASSNLARVALNDALAVAGLRKELSGLDGTNIKTGKSTDTVTASVNQQGAAFRKQTASIDQFSGRLRLLTEAAVIGGPALIAMGAVAAPAIAGLASSMGFAAIGAGTLAAGFSGVFDTLDLLNKAQLEPTEENLQALRQSMQQLSPDARTMVREIDKLGPVLKSLRDASAEGMAPEVERAVDNLIEGLPRLRGLFEETANATAGVLADGAGILTSDRWQPFLNFLEREAPVAIESLGGTTGDLAHGFAELWRAMDPLSDDTLGVFERGAEGFDKWASGLSKTEGFQEFVAYVRENGPLVGDALTSMANAVLQIGEAAAPLGGPVLRAISEIADGVATIADSPLGTPFAAALTGVLALNRALKISAGLSATLAGAGLLGGGKAKGGAASGLLGGAALGAAAGGASKGSALRNIGRDATVAATGLFALDQGIDILDSFSRTMDSSSVSASDGMGKIRASLEDSNVGKYAEDMGINLDRLAKDIYRFGDSGDYYKEAVGQLNSADDGLKGFGKGALDFLNPMIGSTEQAGLAMLDLSRIAGESNGLSTFSGKAKDASSDVKRLARDLYGIEGLKIRPKLDDSPFKSAMKGITRSIDGFDGKKAEAKADLDDSPFSGAIKGVSKLLSNFDGKKGTAKADLDDNPFAQNYGGVNRDLASLNRKRATPTAGLNDSPFRGINAGVMASLGVTDRFTASPTANLEDNASGKLSSISGQMSSLNGRTATTFVNTVMTTIRRIVPGADGMMFAEQGVQTFAGGGLVDPTDIANGHRPEFAGVGPARLWREPETGGESYIPHANDARRPRAMSILEQTAALFGGEVQWQGSQGLGGSRPIPRSAQRQSVSVGFDGPAEVLVRMPDGSTQRAQMQAVARQAVLDREQYYRDGER